MRLGFKNKKGDIQSILYVITVVGAIGIVLFFFSHIFMTMYDEFDQFIEESPTYNNTEVDDAIDTISSAEQSIWDYAFLGIAMSYVLLVGIFGFTQQTHPVFFWISVILSLIGLFIAVTLGSVWQEMAANPEFAETITRFPITNAILGTYYPAFAIFIAFIGLVLLYGKPVGGIGR